MIPQPLREYCQGSILELGPHSGDWYTYDLLELAQSVAVIELDPEAVARLRSNYPRALVIEGDWHAQVRGLGYYDCVLLFGVLNHTHSPLGLLEDIVNGIGPNTIIIEAEPGGVVRCVREEVNEPGQRQSLAKHSGLSIQLGQRVYHDAMTNLGYIQVQRFTENQGDKSGAEYGVYQKANVHISST